MNKEQELKEEIKEEAFDKFFDMLEAKGLAQGDSPQSYLDNEIAEYEDFLVNKSFEKGIEQTEQKFEKIIEEWFKAKSFGTIVLISHNETAKWKPIYKKDIQELLSKLKGEKINGKNKN